MGEVTIDVEAELRRDNPRATAVTLRLYADTLRTYLEAAASVREHGAIVSHPRTGSPIENPYLAIMQRQGAALQKMKVKGDRVLAMIEAAP